jgi:broad specificity phosphatase PhoE
MKLFNNKFIIIVRHAERADMIENTKLDALKCGLYDTELTERGKAQAFETGEKIKQFFEERKMDLNCLENEKKFKLLCSPFARTVITSYKMLKGLNLNSTPIRIERGLCEHLNEKWYPFPPEKFLALVQHEKSKEKKHLHREIFDHKIIHDSKTPLPKYPETHDECAIRLRSVYENITNYYLEECDNQILFLVTHYFPIEVFVKLYSIKEKEMELPCEYCITLAFSYDSSNINNKIKFIEKIYPKI